MQIKNNLSILPPEELKMCSKHGLIKPHWILPGSVKGELFLNRLFQRREPLAFHCCKLQGGQAWTGSIQQPSVSLILTTRESKVFFKVGLDSVSPEVMLKDPIDLLDTHTDPRCLWG